MTRAKLLAIGIGLALVAVFASPAAAQDEPTLTVDPSEVDAPGEVVFTVTGENWTAAPPILILSCPAPESGELADIDTESCDTENLSPATPQDGSFSIEVTYDVPAEGIAIVAADTGQTVAIPALVTVAAQGDPPEGGDDDSGASDEGSDEGADDSAATDGEGDDADDGGLADTGVESGLIAIIAAALLGAGAMVIATTRRFNLR